MNRRDFVKASGLAAASLGSFTDLEMKNLLKQQALTEAVPTQAQHAWMGLGFGLFIHLGISTYYDVECSDGTLDPDKFNPTENHGLKVGFYYSLWDRFNKLRDPNEPAFVDFVKLQMEELLTSCGSIVEMWFEGFWKKRLHGWTKKNQEIDGEASRKDADLQRAQNFIDAWRSEGTYRWQMDHLYQFIKSLQLDSQAMNNSTSAYPGVALHPVDIRSGEKYTEVADDKKVWQWLDKDIYLPLQIETTLSVKGTSTLDRTTGSGTSVAIRWLTKKPCSTTWQWQKKCRPISCSMQGPPTWVSYGPKTKKHLWN